MSDYMAIGYQRTDYYEWEPPETYNPCLEHIEASSAREARLFALRSSEFRRQVQDDRIDGVNPLGSIIIAPAVAAHDGCPYIDLPDEEVQCARCDAIWQDVERRLAALDAKRRPAPHPKTP